MTENFQQSAKYRAAAQVCATLRGAGHAAYFAGGCVRDLLLHRAPSDYDVATSALPEQVLAMFARTQSVGAHFGVVLVQLAMDEQAVLTEVATFRNDGAYSDGRRPDSVSYTSDPRQDVQRRDFTINGMLLDPAMLTPHGEVDAAVLDFVGGKADLAAGIVRAIGDATLRFQEDKLRMPRGVRFAARFSFELEAATERAMRAMAPHIHEVSAERVRDELTRMLTEGHAARAFQLLDQTGLLQQVLPEIARMKGVEQPPEYHPEGDVWVHTLLLLRQLSAGCSPTLAWGALLHDVGKPPTFERAPDRIRFNGHAEIGTRMTEAICRRLRFSLADTQQISELVANHMRFGDVRQMKESTLKRFFRLPKFEEHLELHRLDCAASHGNLSLHEFARERFNQMPPEVAKPVVFVTGNDLIRTGYKPGPKFTEMLAAAEDAQLEDRIGSTDEGMAFIEETFGPPSAHDGVA
jgi:putative nucleotidyltransferase with HDIG domain